MASPEETKELQLLESLKEQAIEQYEELKTENVKAKEEYDKVKQERDEAVKKLEEFSKISHMVIEEVNFMQNHLEIEKTCRESAEALAVKLNKENKNLKRISMLYMAKLGPDVITEEINLDEDDPSSEGDSGTAAVCASINCQQKINDLQEQTIKLQEEKKTVSIELEDLRSKLIDLIEEVNITKKENVMLAKEVFEQRKLLEKCNRVTVVFFSFFECSSGNCPFFGLAPSSLLTVIGTLTGVEVVGRDFVGMEVVDIEEDALLESLRPVALSKLENVTLQCHQVVFEKVKDMEEQLEEAKLRKELQSLRKQLELLEEDKKELEAKCRTSESIVKDLRHSVEELQKRIQLAEKPAAPPPPPPPPLPPPPPPNPIRSLMSMIRKKPSGSASAPSTPKKETSVPDSGHVDLKRQAVDEMMDRIKKGVHLRPVNQTARTKNKQDTTEAVISPPAAHAEAEPEEVKSSGSAVQELKGILDSLNSSGNVRKHKGLGTASTETELERILRRRKVTTEQDSSSPLGTLATLESKSMPVLGSATNSSLRQNPKEARSTATCRSPVGAEQLSFREKQMHLKIASQSSEALGYADKPNKKENSDVSIDVASQSAATVKSKEMRQTEHTDDKKLKDTDSSNC
ncbi:shootin-1 [Bombina bombina]|uniref:shootin-1 n=1 Tax=Bombina bombina TaxID=8345 RepID=UPI00235B210B|nr:shootin-1 [Bombina bombina]